MPKRRPSTFPTRRAQRREPISRLTFRSTWIDSATCAGFVRRVMLFYAVWISKSVISHETKKALNIFSVKCFLLLNCSFTNSLPQRGRGTALAVDEEVALSKVSRPYKYLVLMRKILCATKQNTQNTREIHPNGDLLIHHLRWSPFSAGEGYSQPFDKSKFES